MLLLWGTICVSQVVNAELFSIGNFEFLRVWRIFGYMADQWILSSGVVALCVFAVSFALSLWSRIIRWLPAGTGWSAIQIHNSLNSLCCLLWCETYLPIGMSDLFSIWAERFFLNDNFIFAVVKTLGNWILSPLQILLLCGPPGLGKTTLAHVAAKHCGYRVVEVWFFTSDSFACNAQSRLLQAI